MKEKIDIILTQYTPEFPEEIKIKLPTMKKIGLPKKPELKNNG
jgi:hypothetical protein